MLQQDRLIPLLRELRREFWHVEVETNVTIEPSDEFIKLINQFNCSPKLANAGPDCPLDKRMNSKALNKLAHCGIATFKFVVTCWNDLIELRGIISSFDIDPDSVWLMAEGRTREEQEANQRYANLMANSNGWHFSPRLHVLEHGDVRAV